MLSSSPTLSAAFTFSVERLALSLPSLSTVMVSPSVLTVTLLSATSKPLPVATSYFTVVVLPSLLVTVAVVPVPFVKLTVSPGFTMSF